VAHVVQCCGSGIVVAVSHQPAFPPSLQAFGTTGANTQAIANAWTQALTQGICNNPQNAAQALAAATACAWVGV
jgi:hypothetical protein